LKLSNADRGIRRNSSPEGIRVKLKTINKRYARIYKWALIVKTSDCKQAC